MAEAREEVLTLQRDEEQGAGVVQGGEGGGPPALKKRRVDTTTSDDVDVDVDNDCSRSTTTSSSCGVEQQENKEVPVLELRRCPTERTNGIFPADILLTGKGDLTKHSLHRHLKKPISHLDAVAEHLNVRDLLRCKLVCRWWNSMLAANSVWRSLFLRTFGATPSELKEVCSSVLVSCRRHVVIS